MGDCHCSSLFSLSLSRGRYRVWLWRTIVRDWMRDHYPFRFRFALQHPHNWGFGDRNLTILPCLCPRHQILLHHYSPVPLLQLQSCVQCAGVNPGIMQGQPLKLGRRNPTAHTKEAGVCTEVWVPGVHVIQEQVKVMGFKVTRLTGISARTIFDNIPCLWFGRLSRVEGAMSARNPWLMKKNRRVPFSLLYWTYDLAGDHTRRSRLPLARHGVTTGWGGPVKWLRMGCEWEYGSFSG